MVWRGVAWRVVVCRAVPCFVLPCHVSHVVLCRTVWCRVLSCHIVLCCGAPGALVHWCCSFSLVLLLSHRVIGAGDAWDSLHPPIMTLPTPRLET